MRLSIIIPTHGSRTILKTIKSIYGSSGMNRHDFEIIVVDDASGNLDIGNFPTVKVLRFEKQRGASAARNRGIGKASGEVLFFIDSDMWLNKQTVASLMKHIKNNDIVFPKIVYENGQMMYPVLEIEKRYPHISGCFLIKKGALGKLDENFDEFYGTYLEDYDFFIRCSLAGLKAWYVEDAVVIHENKEKQDYGSRYYLETRNLMYGHLKLGKSAKKSGLYNPFTFSAIIKSFVFGALNFAWFNWHGYDRKEKKMQDNKIFPKNRFRFIGLFAEAIIDILKNLGLIFKKGKQVRKFYNPRQ